MPAESVGHPSADQLRPQVSPEHRRQHQSLRTGVVAELARERDYRDRDADAIDVAKRGAEEKQRDDRVALWPSRDSRRSIARSCRLAHGAIELRLRDAQKKRREGQCSRVLSVAYSRIGPWLFPDGVSDGIQNVAEIARRTHVAEQRHSREHLHLAAGNV